MLQITNLTTSLFEDVNLQVEPNQIVAITGNNGSGKSTLAKVIAGYYQAEAGVVNLPAEQIGLLTQNPYLQFIGNTVFDELTYSLEQDHADPRVIEAVLKQCPFPLAKNLDELSGGEAQRLLIYKELHSSKQLLILDETLSNLDQDAKDELIAELRTSNKAIILITNNLNDTNYASVVYQLENKCLSRTDDRFAAVDLVANHNPVTLEYRDYQFKQGLNIVTGQSAGGKTTLITDLCFELKHGISLIPQYPFEVVTTLDGSHIYSTEYAKRVNLHHSKFSQNITELSTGELVKVLVIEAVLSGNQTLVLDESIEVLDKCSQTMVLDLITEVFETIIIVSHNKYLFNGYPVNVVEVNYEANNN